MSDARPAVALPCHDTGGPDDECGRGLLIVRSLATRWGVLEHAEGKTVWFELATGATPVPVPVPQTIG